MFRMDNAVMPEGLTSTVVEVPEAEPDQNWRDYQSLVRANSFETIGSDSWDASDEEAAVSSRKTIESGDHKVTRVLYRLGETPVAKADNWMTVDRPGTAHINVWVHPDYRGRGIGSWVAQEYLAQIEALDEVDTIDMWEYVPLPQDADGHPQWAPKSGAGSVPADAPGTKLLRRHGFELSQVVTVSRYRFGDDNPDLVGLLAEATERAGGEYRIHAWEGATPERWEAGITRLKERMFTDAPHGDFEVVPAKWDVERLRRHEAYVLTQQRRWVTAAEHIPSGELVAFNEVHTRRADPSKIAEQADTLVLTEHRGRPLGVAVKAANLEQVAREVPDAGDLLTWNAAENEHMLNVNRQVGFRPILVEGGFTKKVR